MSRDRAALAPTRVSGRGRGSARSSLGARWGFAATSGAARPQPSGPLRGWIPRALGLVFLEKSGKSLVEDNPAGIFSWPAGLPQYPAFSKWTGAFRSRRSGGGGRTELAGEELTSERTAAPPGAAWVGFRLQGRCKI